MWRPARRHVILSFHLAFFGWHPRGLPCVYCRGPTIHCYVCRCGEQQPRSGSSQPTEPGSTTASCCLSGGEYGVWSLPFRPVSQYTTALHQQHNSQGLPGYKTITLVR